METVSLALRQNGRRVAVTLGAALAVVTAMMSVTPTAAEAKPEPKYTTTIVVIDRDYDANGNFLGEARREPQTSDSSGSVDADAGDDSGVGTMRVGGGGYGVQSGSGCRTTTVGIVRRSFWDQFSISHTKQYCWGSGRVYGWNWQGDPSSWTSFNNIDGQHVLRGTSFNAYYRYYSSAYGASYYGAHYTRATFSVETCIVGRGCVWTEYPYIEITVRNNGTYSYFWFDGDGSG